MHVLVTGGSGYIGSHTVLELLKDGHQVSVVDNLSNSSEESLRRITKMTGKKIAFHNFDLVEGDQLDKLFSNNSFDVVMHFAGFKAVGESVYKPIKYYQNNLDSTLSLCQVMSKHGVKKLIFSSSAVVYGPPDRVPITEDMLLHPTNPYGHTKAMIEQILSDIVQTNQGWEITALRYFNPIGADESDMIGEDPTGIPNNLVPYISQVAVGKLDKLKVFGNDYDTPDGTGIRDYIHVTDVAKGHVAAMHKLPRPNHMAIYNLGTGKGNSVLEVIEAFKKASGKDIPYVVAARRPGDIAEYFASVSKVKDKLNWQVEKIFFRPVKILGVGSQKILMGIANS